MQTLNLETQQAFAFLTADPPRLHTVLAGVRSLTSSHEEFHDLLDDQLRDWIEQELPLGDEVFSNFMLNVDWTSLTSVVLQWQATHLRVA